MKPTTANQGRKPDFNVCCASNFDKKGPQDNDYPKVIGAAWKNPNAEGYFIRLFALPLDGRLFLFPHREDEQDGGR